MEINFNSKEGQPVKDQACDRCGETLVVVCDFYGVTLCESCLDYVENQYAKKD